MEGRREKQLRLFFAGPLKKKVLHRDLAQSPPPVFPSKANACLWGWQEGPLDTVSTAGPRATQHRPGLATGRGIDANWFPIFVADADRWADTPAAGKGQTRSGKNRWKKIHLSNCFSARFSFLLQES